MLKILPLCEIAMIAASMSQAVISPAAAVERESFPRCVRCRWFSWMIRASTGKAVILMAIPMKRAKGVKSVRLEAYSVYIA